VLLLHQVIPGSERHQMGVVGRSGNGNRSGTADIGVAELVGELLKLISVKRIVVPEDVVVAGPGGALDALVRTEVEVKLCWMSDGHVHSGSSRDVARLPRLFPLVSAEQSCVMSLLHHDKGDSWAIVSLKLDAGLPDCSELVLEDS